MEKQITIESIEIVNQGGANFQKFVMKDADGNKYTAFRSVEPKQWLSSHAEVFSVMANSTDDEEFRDGLRFIAKTSRDLSDKF